MTVTPPDPFVALMRRYVNDYTNRHDTTVCKDIMEPDYTLRMGPHIVTGRDDNYIPAAQRQFRQFPGLCLTVHEIVTNGARLAMRFSEHGASTRDGSRVSRHCHILILVNWLKRERRQPKPNIDRERDDRDDEATDRRRDRLHVRRICGRRHHPACDSENRHGRVGACGDPRASSRRTGWT